MRYRFCTYHKESRTRRQGLHFAHIGAIVSLLPLALASLPGRADSSQPGAESDFHSYLVRRGETLTQIARKYGLSKHELAAANRLTTVSVVRRGQKLRIPTSKPKRAKETEGASKPPSITFSNRNDADRRISLSFSEVDVRQALTTISDYSRTDIMVMPGGAGNVSISLRGRTADEAIRLTAATAGLSVVKVGSTYLVGKAEEVKKAITEFGQTQMVPLHKAAFQEAKEFLARAAPLVSVQAAGNGVLLTGLPDDIAAARTALRDLDENRPPVVAPKQDTNIFTLHYADPESVEKILHEALPDMKIALQDRTLILSGTQVMLAAADLALKQIDVETSAAAEKTEAYVYRLKYLNAQTAETSLKKALPGLNIAAAPEPTSPPPATFSPLSINTLGGIGGTGGGSGGSGGGLGGGGSSLGGGGQSMSGQNGGAGGQGGTVQNQTLSRSVRLIITGPSTLVQRAKLLLDQADVAPPLVRIEAALVEVNRSTLKDLGLKWDFTDTKFTFSLPPAAGVDVGQVQRSGTSTTVSLQALITQNKARVLAAPNISVIDNEDANIFIGDLLRFPGSTVVTPNSGTVQNIETIPVGIALLVRPRIHPNDEVTLKVHPVVSSLSGFRGTIPQTSSREADTTVRLKAGEELVIGGLSRKEFTSALSKVPLLGDLPIIGQLFQTRNRQTTETEILIFIRVYPVQTQPAPEDQSSVLPEDALERTDKRLRTQKSNTKQAPK